MILSTKGRYAVMAMVDLAQSGGEKPVALSEIAKRQEIPLAYLEQIFSKLKRAGLVRALRGPGGGYRLTKSPAETMVAAIILAAEESIRMTRCSSGDHGGCLATKSYCLTHELWEGLGYQIYHYLRSISLADVCARRLKEKFPYDPAEMRNLDRFTQMLTAGGEVAELR
ncbi:MAG: Rrf2 family transcriptional regulator [Alphaproteobacteria bacterium]